jgi:hypothetical protein
VALAVTLNDVADPFGEALAHIRDLRFSGTRAPYVATYSANTTLNDAANSSKESHNSPPHRELVRRKKERKKR